MHRDWVTTVPEVPRSAPAVTSSPRRRFRTCSVVVSRRQCAQVLSVTGGEILELGAGTGRMAARRARVARGGGGAAGPVLHTRSERRSRRAPARAPELVSRRHCASGWFGSSGFRSVRFAGSYWRTKCWMRCRVSGLWLKGRRVHERQHVGGRAGSARVGNSWVGRPRVGCVTPGRFIHRARRDPGRCPGWCLGKPPARAATAAAGRATRQRFASDSSPGSPVSVNASSAG